MALLPEDRPTRRRVGDDRCHNPHLHRAGARAGLPISPSFRRGIRGRADCPRLATAWQVRRAVRDRHCIGPWPRARAEQAGRFERPPQGGSCRRARPGLRPASTLDRCHEGRGSRCTLPETDHEQPRRTEQVDLHDIAHRALVAPLEAGFRLEPDDQRGIRYIRKRENADGEPKGTARWSSDNACRGPTVLRLEVERSPRCEGCGTPNTLPSQQEDERQSYCPNLADHDNPGRLCCHPPAGWPHLHDKASIPFLGELKRGEGPDWQRSEVDDNYHNQLVPVRSLHGHPTARQRFRDSLRRELPSIESRGRDCSSRAVHGRSNRIQ